MSITPFQIHIPDSELDLLNQKLSLARLPTSTANAQWPESNGVTLEFMISTVDFWRNNFNWREQEARLNKLPMFTTPIEVDNFGTLNIHFIHSRTAKPDAIPLLFLHGWPGSFVEVTKILPELSEAGFDVVAPSLPGFGFSESTDKKGFKIDQHAETLHKLMLRLGYGAGYVVQGGDWGSWIGRTMGILYPESLRGMHLNMFCMSKPSFDQEPTYNEFENRHLDHMNWFRKEQSAYSAIQSQKPATLGYALHDSPLAMLAWMADKLFLWSDNYPWPSAELITFTLLYYFPGPATALDIYHENPATDLMDEGTVAKGFVRCPTGISAFKGEPEVAPRSWVETKANVVFWKEQEKGGHFAAYEVPDVLVEDLVEFFTDVWRERKE